jgi:hypothetical protein
MMLLLACDAPAAPYPLVEERLSVTNEHTMAVQESHACHNTPAALLRSLLGVPEHLLKFTVEFSDASVFELQP